MVNSNLTKIIVHAITCAKNYARIIYQLISKNSKKTLISRKIVQGFRHVANGPHVR